MARYVFGPVPSRRLGRSLGIDVLPRKMCSLDCVYCECGPTETLTLQRSETVPTDAVLDEIDAVLSLHPQLDSVTFSGTGEPTLHLHLGRMIQHIHDKHPGYVVTLLTNGVLFPDPQVRADAALADRVIPNLDAVSQEVFEAINRPAVEIDNATVIESLVRFRDEFGGELWLEIFIVPGVNDSPQELQLLAEAAVRIRPHRIQLNSLDRPPAYGGIQVPNAERWKEIAAFFPGAEILARGTFPIPAAIVSEYARERILETLRRRPLTFTDILVQTGLHVHEAQKILQYLLQEKHIEQQGDFYRIR